MMHVEKDVNPFRYAGEYFDLSSGTYYLRNHYYNPNNGRFLTEDPIQSGLNWYTYAGNNPNMFIDPSGIEHIVVSGGVYKTEKKEQGKYYGEFIDTGLKKLHELKDANDGEVITWIIADAGWDDVEKSNFEYEAAQNGFNIKFITDAQQLSDHIASGNDRQNDKIKSFTVFTHGLPRDNGVIALGYNYGSYNTNLNFGVNNIQSNFKNAFDNPISYFYTCNTGTTGDSSFAQK